MAFADHYPLEAFQAISHVSWWRSSDISFKIRSKKREAMMNGTGPYTVSDDTEAFIEEAKKADAADRITFDEGEKIFNAAIEAHLEDLRLQGRLGKITGLNGRKVDKAKAWNDFIDGKKDEWQYPWMIQTLGHSLTSVMVGMDKTRHDRQRENPLTPHQLPSNEQVIAAWEKLCNAFDDGDSDPIYRIVFIDDITDSKTGDRCQIHFTNWQAQLMVQGSDFRYSPAKDVAKIPLAAAQFDVPSGDLLLTDFLRVEGMQDALDFGTLEYEKELSISKTRCAHLCACQRT